MGSTISIASAESTPAALSESSVMTFDVLYGNGDDGVIGVGFSASLFAAAFVNLAIASSLDGSFSASSASRTFFALPWLTPSTKLPDSSTIFAASD